MSEVSPFIPELKLIAVSHESKRPEALVLPGFADVELSLDRGQSRFDTGSLGFGNGKDLWVFLIEDIVANVDR